jgi:propanediol dehydratase small subunit
MILKSVINNSVMKEDVNNTSPLSLLTKHGILGFWTLESVINNSVMREDVNITSPLSHLTKHGILGF